MPADEDFKVTAAKDLTTFIGEKVVLVGKTVDQAAEKLVPPGSKVDPAEEMAAQTVGATTETSKAVTTVQLGEKIVPVEEYPFTISNDNSELATP